MIRRASSPGKLILTGEHAVLAGAPALVMAVSREVRVDATPLPCAELRIRLPDRPTTTFALSDLPALLRGCRERLAAARAGTGTLSTVTGSPEILLAAAAALAEIEAGWDLQYHSELPLGSGMGSSAAFLLATLKALRPGVANSHLFNWGLEAEHFQHGRSSGLDLTASLGGGLWWREAGNARPLTLPRLPPFRLFHSGKPAESTGECVARVAQHFPSAHAIWQRFDALARETRARLLAEDVAGWRNCVRCNHALLVEIGVVPFSVQKAISALEQAGGAAKVCGAGALSGVGGGVVLVLADDTEPLPADWSPLPCGLSSVGTRLLSP